jgi:cell division protein FtsQ
MYYRGARVSLSESKPRFHSAEVWKRSRTEKKEENRLFVKWFFHGEKPVVYGEKKTYAFYRPGITQVEDTPAFSKREKAWVLKTPSLGGAKWVIRLGGLVLLVAAVVWSKEKTTVLLQDVAGLKLEKVSVEGNHYLTEEEIVNAVALPLGENMFKLDLTEASERVKKMDWVDRVFIERRLPRSILISVREKKPVALLDNENIYGVDQEGRILSASPSLLREDLPLISGVSFPTEAVGTTRMAETLKPALNFFTFLRKKDPVLAQDVSEVNLAQPDSIKVTFIDGIVATFDPSVGESELRRMALVLSDLNQKGKRAGTMDFRYRDMVLVKTRE